MNQGKGIYLVRELERFMASLEESRDEAFKATASRRPMERIVQKYNMFLLLIRVVSQAIECYLFLVMQVHFQPAASGIAQVRHPSVHVDCEYRPLSRLLPQWLLSPLPASVQPRVDKPHQSPHQPGVQQPTSNCDVAVLLEM